MHTLASPRVILITGATGAIGQALALEYAHTGNTLILQGRQAAVLDSLAQQCTQRGALVVTRVVDLTDHQAWQTCLAQLLAQWPVELCILNAGLNTEVGPHGEAEPWPAVEALLDVNLKSVMLTVHALLPGMRQRGSGQIAIMSSLAAWFGLPDTPTYSATKAALKTYGESLRGWLAGDGIAVNVIMPGYIRSDMCDRMPGPKPFLLQPAQAAGRIRRALAADCPRITFPFPLNWGTRLLAWLPVDWSLSILKWLGYKR